MIYIFMEGLRIAKQLQDICYLFQILQLFTEQYFIMVIMPHTLVSIKMRIIDMQK